VPGSVRICCTSAHGSYGHLKQAGDSKSMMKNRVTWARLASIFVSYRIISFLKTEKKYFDEW
jgi:hypothetical protein